jgi:hypothetical protein
MSAIAAIGIPKLLAGPQKSIFVLANFSFPLQLLRYILQISSSAHPFPSSSNARCPHNETGVHTSRAKVIRVLVGANLRIEGFDRGGHLD